MIKKGQILKYKIGGGTQKVLGILDGDLYFLYVTERY